jgi:hypothetical protein
LLKAKHRKKCNLNSYRCFGVKHTDIILYPHCHISIKYNPVQIGTDYIIKEVSEITFDLNKIKEKRDLLLTLIKELPSSTD